MQFPIFPTEGQETNIAITPKLSDEITSKLSRGTVED